MNIYRLEYQHTQETIGETFPQSQKIVEDPVNWQSSNHIMSVWSKFPLNIHIPDSILHSRAKLTDLVSSSPIRHPIISERLKLILEKYRTDGLEFAVTGLLTGKKRVQYWIMNGYDMDYENIDYARSSIVKAGIGMTKIDQLNIQSVSDLKEAIREMKPPEGVWIEKLVLRDDVKDDIFFLDRVDGSNYYVSERLKDEIIAAGCTGLVFVNYNEEYPG